MWNSPYRGRRLFADHWVVHLPFFYEFKCFIVKWLSLRFSSGVFCVLPCRARAGAQRLGNSVRGFLRERKAIQRFPLPFPRYRSRRHEDCHPADSGTGPYSTISRNKEASTLRRNFKVKKIPPSALPLDFTSVQYIFSRNNGFLV